MTKMNAGIITIGDELLIGETTDTNATWLAKSLDDAGLHVLRIYTIEDDEEEIHSHLNEMLKDVQFVVITGGLGPTHDDVTKYALCNFFKDELVFNETVYKGIEKMMVSFGKDVSALNRTQAMIPSTCKALLNFHGTAPGMKFEFDDKTVISMPGVPHEMKYIMNEHVLPHVKGIDSDEKKIHRHIKTFGIAEADLATKLSALITQLDDGIKLAFLPSPGIVKIRITAKGVSDSEALEKISKIESEILSLLGDYCFAFESDKMESVVGNILSKNQSTLSTAESCTGGKLASILTSIPGSSVYFIGSVIAYNNDIKETQLKVSKEKLINHGAVSEEVVSEMASNVREIMKTNYALATSGIAGPDGGTPEKPVGTIWIALATEKKILTKKLQLGFNRETNIRITAMHCLNLLRKELQNNI